MLLFQNALAYILTTPEFDVEKNSNYTKSYLGQYLDTNICNNYNSENTLTLKQAVNITIACNRNVHKLLLSRVTENYNLDVAEYKFKPNMNLTMSSSYSEQDNTLKKYTDKSANITPKFSILTPIGTNINLEWDNHASSLENIETFKNASKITITQPLLKQSGYDLQTASIKNAKANNNFQLFQIYDQIENEINKTIFTYRQIIQNQNQLEIQEKILEISKKLLAQTKALIKAGRLAQYEQTQVESQVATQEVALADARINLRQSYLLLANQLGIGNIYFLPQNFKLQAINSNAIQSPKKTNIQEIFSTVLENNVIYQSILLQQQVAQRDYYTAYDQSRWTLDLTASYQLHGYDDNYNKSLQKHFSSSDQNRYIGLQFNIPLDSNPNRSQALVENKIRIKQLELDKKQSEQEIYSDTQDRLYQQNILWDKVQLAKKAVEIQQQNFDMAQKKYEAGRLSSFELVRIQDDVEKARVSENSSIIAYLNNQTIIDKLLNTTFNTWDVALNIQ